MIGLPDVNELQFCVSTSSDDAERVVLFWQADFRIRVFQVAVEFVCLFRC